jgi:uncharacterized membrane protein
MNISPDERRKIYEEEKARIEAEKRQSQQGQSSTLDLKPGTAGVLCYLGGWITGIIFLVLEQKNRTVRFHAVQSILVFGFTTLVYLILRPIPYAGVFFGSAITIIGFILWLFLMIKASQGKYSLPVAGDLAEKLLSSIPGAASGTTAESAATSPPPAQQSIQAEVINPQPFQTPRHFDRNRAGRIAASAFAIAFSIALLIFFNFYHDYIAAYHLETRAGTSTWVHQSILTSAYFAWLPIVNTALIFGIAGHVLLLAVDKYLLREAVLLILDIFSIVSIAALLLIFPFDFNVFGASAVGPIDFSVRISLAIIIFGTGIGVLVRLIKVLVNLVRGIVSY